MLSIMEPETVSQTLESFAQLDNNQLADKLQEAMSLTVRGIITAAAAFKLLDERDAAPDGISASTRRMLLAVAENRLLPELVVDFAGRKRLAGRVELLPIKEQRQLTDDKPVRVCVGGADVRMIRPSQMDDRTLRQVFAQDHIRDESEQRTWLDANPEKPKPSQTRPNITLNKKQGFIEVGGPCRITAGELLDWVQKLTAK